MCRTYLEDTSLSRIDMWDINETMSIFMHQSNIRQITQYIPTRHHQCIIRTEDVQGQAWDKARRRNNLMKSLFKRVKTLLHKSCPIAPRRLLRVLLLSLLPLLLLQLLLIAHTNLWTWSIHECYCTRECASPGKTEHTYYSGIYAMGTIHCCKKDW